MYNLEYKTIWYFFFSVLRVSNVFKAIGSLLHQLRHAEHNPVAEEQRGWARLQRVRPLLQVARGQPASGYAKGGDSDEEEKAEEWIWGIFLTTG